MIDLHCHILPGVDDGSPDLEESLAMARLAAESGVTDIVATSHCDSVGNPLQAETVHALVRAVQAALDREGIPLRLHPGMEIMGWPDTAEKLAAGELLTLNGSRYPLVEFPFRDYEREATALLETLLEQGLRPVVAHPERYIFLQREPRLVNIWADMGCLLQVNRGSLLGRFGPAEEALGWDLVDRGFAAAAASDGHRSTFRTTWMADVRDALADRWGGEAAEILLEENPRRILNNLDLECEEPDWF